MPPRNNILTFITALIVSAQTLPRNIGQVSFVYDPNSIAQNEQILRLFLHLASHTANRLIHLKNEAKVRQASMPDVETIMPEVRIELTDDHPRQRIGGRGYYGHYGQNGRLRYPYEQAPSRKPFSDEARGPYNSGYRDHSEMIRPYVPGSLNEVPSQNYGRNRGRYAPDRRDNGQDPVETKKSNKKPSSNDSVMLTQVSDKSFDGNVPSLKSQEKLERSSQDNGTEDVNNIPVEIESRMLFSVEKNNDVTRYNDSSRNINNADTRINTIASPNQQAASIPQLQPVVVNQNADSSGFHGYKERSNINQANTEVNNVGSGSSGPVVVAQNAGSMLTSQNSGTSTKKVGSAASNIESRSSERTQQTRSANFHLESGSAGVKSAAQRVTSVISNAGGSEIARQAMNVTSSLQSGSAGVKSAAQRVTSMISNAGGSGIARQAKNATSSLQAGSAGVESAAQGMASVVNNAGGSGIAHQALNATSRQTKTVASKLHSVSSGMISSAQGSASEARSTDAGSEMSRQALALASHVQSGVTKQLSAVQHAGSKVFIGTMATATENQVNPMTTALAGNQHHNSSGNHELFGMIDQNKSGGILTNGNPGTSASLDQGSSLANSSQAMSRITNVESGTAGKVMRAARNTSLNVVQGYEKPVTSMVQRSTVKAGKLLGGLTGAGSKFIGSVVLERGSGSRTASETSFQRGSASSALMKSGGDSASQVGPSLVGSVPLFRSFPDVYDESSTPKKSVLDTTQSKSNLTGAIDGQTSLNQQSADNQGILMREDKTSTASQNLQSRNTSTKGRPSDFYDEYANNEEVFEDRVSELDLEEYANQFADALRPVESIGGRSR